MNGQEPSITQTDPRAYYLWLQTQRVPPYQAVQMVQQRFGAPKSPEEQARQRANQAQSNALAQTGGTIGGILVTQEALKGFPNLAGLFGSGAGTAGATAMPTALGGAGALGGATGAGAVATPVPIGAQVVGGTAGTGTTAGASTLGSVGSVALPVALTVAALSTAWETGMKDILRGRGTREDYINQAVNMATGFGPNLALKLMGKRSIGKMMTTGKSDAQLLRDDFRGMLRQSGVADDNFNVALADGSTFNVGLDGKTKYQNVGKNIDGKTSRNAWDVDFSNPLANFAVGQIDPLIRNIYKGMDGKVKPEQYTGMLVNAVTSNAKSEKDVLANIQTMLSKSTFNQQPGQQGAPQVRPPAPNAPQVQIPPQAKPAKQTINNLLKPKGK
jgi:hypothetical protein